MSTLSKRWIVATPAPSDILESYPNMGPILAQVLYNRGFTDAVSAEHFIDAKSDLGDPYQMLGINQAVHRVKLAIKRREPIVVYGDFDADGVTSTTLLMQTLTALGAVVKPYIPHRVDEGYGLNSEALLRLAREGVKLVITVDCGIRSVDEVEDGKAAGLDLIVTDHHTIGPEIPKALAVINPKQANCKYPEDMLAGVGVAFRLADGLIRAVKADRKEVKLELEDLLDLVAIGTVADLAPMNRTENRALVRRGLEVINRANRPGVRALLEVAGVKPGMVNAMNIGFALGPRINAAGRLESAMIAYHLLSAQDYSTALRLAEQLQGLNVKRQDLTREAQDEVRTWVEAQSGDAPLIFASGEFLPGIVGLVAGRLTEEFSRPTVIMERGETESRASCRSIPQFDITHALDQCADLLVRHGGHAQAAGFTVLNENIPALKAKLMKLAEDTLSGRDLRPMLEIDVEIHPKQLTEWLVHDLTRLEPTGYHSSAPVFMTSNLKVLESRTVGKEGHHLKLKLARPGQPPLDAIGFNLGHWIDEMPERIDVAYQLEMNEWNGNRTLQLNMQDIRPAGST
ncbi:MAG: single-stranded-DNA-specific exonuclease RecJ [Chloroflexi bacterium]|nr:single-stranded-DNA-specific exonuclease RecJ [Chloroflexota bacterium]MCC6896461.1 single-stranded-DNA-specific exonuclease RecJ [Anaerolineae bacterium]